MYNDPEVLESSLARSIAEGITSAPRTEFIPVDNRGNPFSTAGAALNHGARQARNEVVAFVHQDVVLHSLAALEEAGAVLMGDPALAIAGAVGINANDGIMGRIRDRVVIIGEPAAAPLDVDSLDEVLLLIERERVLREPLSEDPLLAWHAYGVEYCARSRDAGLRAVALDIPLTHNSLTTNLKDLDLAHGKVGELYPGILPLRTTCGTIWGDDARGNLQRRLRRTRGARIWWHESLQARALASVASSSPIVLADIRVLIDKALDHAGMESLRVLNLPEGDRSAYSVTGLVRYGRSFAAATVSPSIAREAIENRDARELLLVTAADVNGIRAIGPLDDFPHVVGHSDATGFWILIGVPAATLAPLWSRIRNRPLSRALRSPAARSIAH